MGVEKKSNGRFQARYIKNGKRITVGTFDSRVEARQALAKARGDVFASQETIDTDFSKGLELNQDAPLKLRPPMQPSRWERFKAWLRPKAN